MTLETTRRRFLVGSGLVAAAAVSLPAFAQDRPKLRFSAVFSEQDIRAEMMQMFAEAIKDDFDFEGYYGGNLFKQGTELVAIQRGNLEMGNIAPQDVSKQRSDERRVGKECVSTCRSRWSPYHKTKNKEKKK